MKKILNDNKKHFRNIMAKDSSSLKPKKFKEANPKKKIIIASLVFSILLISGGYLYKTFAAFSAQKQFNVINGKVADPGNIYFTYYVDNKISLEPPASSAGYTLDTAKSSCTNNVSLNWDRSNYSLIVNHQNYKSASYSKTKCNLYFKKDNPTLINKITDLSKSTSSNLKTDDFSNIRYIGSNPSNYVYFNCSDYNNPTSSTCEKWRIIGLMKNIKDESGTTSDLVKIIRDTTMSSVKYGITNNFSGSKMQTTLNSSLKNDATKNLTVNAVWSLGGASTVKTPYEMYSIERGTTVYGSNAKTITTRVGLMYPSDYGYATSGSVLNSLEMCSKTNMDKWTTYPNCAKNDWLANSGTYPQLTMTHYTGNSYIMYSVYTSGEIGTTLTQRADGEENPYNDAKPAVYLKANLVVSGGTGSTYSPYTLSNATSAISTDVAADNGKMLDVNSSSCNNNVTISWNDTTNKIVINLKNYKITNKARTKCNLTFKANIPTVVKKVTQLASTDKTNLVTDEAGNVRYIGKDPNNYVSIDGDIWRIIGVMKNIDDGSGNKEERVKIIRSTLIGGYSWDTSESSINDGRGVNEWSQADLMKLLNPGYESETVGGSLYWNNKSGTCYGYYNNETTSCNFTSTGIKDKLKNMIGNAVWNTGASTTYNQIASKWYTEERGIRNGKICTSGIDCNDTVARTTTWTGKVGLMYPSDYGYATSGGSVADRATCLNTILGSWSRNSDCYNNDWLFNSSKQWTLAPYASSSDANHVFYVNNSGEVNNPYASNNYFVRPVVYLLPSVGVQSGDGSPGNPFILG